MRDTAAAETIEEYIARVRDALQEDGELYENELMCGADTSRVHEINFGSDGDYIVPDLAIEVREQLECEGVWRDDLTIRVDDYDAECFNLCGTHLNGTLATYFTVLSEGRPLWSALMNIGCAHSMTEELATLVGDAAELSRCESLEGMAAYDWWEEHGVDADAIMTFTACGVDIGDVEFEGDEEDEAVLETSSIRIVKSPSPKPEPDPRLGIAHRIRRYDRDLVETEKLIGDVFENKDVQLASGFSLFRQLDEKLRAAGYGEPVELELESELRDLFELSVIWSSTKPRDCERLPRGDAPVPPVYLKRFRANGLPEVETWVSNKRISTWDLEELLDEDRWIGTWMLCADFVAEKTPAVLATNRAAFRQEQLDGLNGNPASRQSA